MGQQLVIPNFHNPHDITLERVMASIAKPQIEYLPPSNKEIRLAIDLAKQMNPLFKFHVQEHTDLIRRICRFDVSDEKILNVKPFKQILFKEIISDVVHLGDGKFKVKLKRVRRTHT